MSPHIIIEEIKTDHHKITYKNKIFGVVEYRIVYGNKYYYAHIDGMGIQYNSFEDAVAHLFWRRGFTIDKAHQLVGIK
jgi:hypothetical protein